MTYLDVAPWGNLYIEIVGSGPAVVLVHGAAQDTRSWRFVTSTLVDAGYRAVAIDLPGHGKSDLSPDGPVDDLAVYGSCVVEAIRLLGIGPATVVGHSMSAGVALHAAMQAPEAVSVIVSVDGAGFTNGTYNDTFFELVKKNPQDWFEVNFRTICSPQTPDQRVNDIAFDVHRCPEDVAWHDIAAYASLDIRAKLADLTRPVAFIHGADDWSITPTMAEETRMYCSQVPTSMSVLDETGHFPHVEAPERFNVALLDALGTHVADRSVPDRLNRNGGAR